MHIAFGRLGMISSRYQFLMSVPHFKCILWNCVENIATACYICICICEWLFHLLPISSLSLSLSVFFTSDAFSLFAYLIIPLAIFNAFFLPRLSLVRFSLLCSCVWKHISVRFVMQLVIIIWIQFIQFPW